MEHFYIFELQMKYHFKFGMTKKNDHFERLKQYTGLNKPSRIVKIFAVDNGILEEDKFYEFLKQNNVLFFSDKEFFYYDRDINELIQKYNENKNNISLKHSQHRMVYNPGAYVVIKTLKKYFQKNEINKFTTTYKLQKKALSLCKECNRKANRKCCKCSSGFNRKNRRKYICFLDMCIK